MTVVFSLTSVGSCDTVVEHNTKVNPSVLCEIQIFYQAFAGSTDAWAMIYTRYTPFVRSWIGSQSVIDPEEVAQEAWLAFTCYAPRQPCLLEDGSLARVLGYLRTCVKTAIVRVHRREQWYAGTCPFSDEDTVAQTANIDSILVQRITIQECVNQILTSDDDRLLFELRFVRGMKPQAITNTYTSRFADVRTVYTRISQLVRRLRADPILQSLCLPQAEVCV